MKQINYYVRTTLDRKLDNSYNQIDYILLVDKEYKPLKSFIEQLKIISNTDSVLLEDDLILCKDFKKEIEEVINKYPNDIINFFSFPNDYFKTKRSYIFSSNQCTYYPKGLSLIVANEIEKISKTTECIQYDVLECKALRNLGLSHIIYRPCLVQHIDGERIIKSIRHWKHRTPYFIDDLKELGIDYEDKRIKFERGKMK